MSNNVIVTDWEAVDEDDFYLQDDWGVKHHGMSKKTMAGLRRQAKNGKLFKAYRVAAVTYCVYREMDAQSLIINEDREELIEGEGAVIGNEHKDVWEDGNE